MPRSKPDSLSSARPSTTGDEAPQSQILRGVKVYSEDTAYVIATAGRYLIQIVRERMTATAVSLIRRAFSDLSEQYPTFGYLAILEPQAQLLLPTDIREGVQAIVKRYSPRFTGAAIVFEKSGFHATAVRSVVTAINFASRATHPNQIFADLREAVSWLSQLTPGEPTATRLLLVARHLRSAGASTPSPATPPRALEP